MGEEIEQKSCSKVFFQLLCPSCCGSLYEKSTESVYMKRQSKIQRSINIHDKSETGTICCNIEEIENNKEPNTSPIPQVSSVLESASQKLETESNISIRNEKLSKLKQTTQEELIIGNTLNEELNNSVFQNGTVLWNNNKLRRLSRTHDELSPNDANKTDTMVVEMKIGNKQRVEVMKNNENEPPFDFQSNLRKVNTDRISLRRFSAKSENHFISEELRPGLILEGTVYDV